MGLLLMQYEYQKAKQKSNVLQLKGIRLHDKQEMYTKRLSSIETLFSKKKTQIESKWSQASSRIANVVSTQAANGFTDGSASIFANLGISVNNKLMGDIETAFNTGLNQVGANASAEATEMQKQQAAAAERSALASQLTSLLQEIMNSMKEAELAQLEEKEDAQREPIAEKDAEIQAAVAENDTLSSLAKEREDAAKNRLPDTVKSSVAHYGLS